MCTLRPSKNHFFRYLNLAGDFPLCSFSGKKISGPHQDDPQNQSNPPLILLKCHAFDRSYQFLFLTKFEAYFFALKPHVIKHGLPENAPFYFDSFAAVNLHLVQGFPS